MDKGGTTALLGTLTTIADAVQDLVVENRKLKKQVKSTESLDLEIENLKKSLQLKANDFEDQKQSRQVWQDKASPATRNLLEAEEVAATNPFAMVLVDGDGYVFPDDLLRQGVRGGEEAAQRLLDEVQNYLQNHKGAKQWRIIVRVFVNLDGLAKKCQSLDIVNHTNVVREFYIGFAQNQPPFDVVDVGYGKERADHKIRGELVQSLHSLQLWSTYWI